MDPSSSSFPASTQAPMPSSTHGTQPPLPPQEDLGVAARVQQTELDGESGAWTQDSVRALLRWKSQAFVHMYLQDKSSYHFRLIYNALTFPVILLSTISSTTIFSADNTQVRVFVATVSITCACLAALQRQVRPAENAEHHWGTAHRYQSLIHRIESCLNMVPGMRPTMRRFVEAVRSEFDALLRTQRDPPRYVLSRFERSYGRVEGILYGDEIAEMIAQSLRIKAMYKRLSGPAPATPASPAAPVHAGPPPVLPDPSGRDEGLSSAGRILAAASSARAGLMSLLGASLVARGSEEQDSTGGTRDIHFFMGSPAISLGQVVVDDPSLAAMPMCVPATPPDPSPALG